MNLTTITYAQHVLISAPRIPTDFLWGLSLLFVIVALLYFVSVFIFRNRLAKNEKRIMAKRKVFSPMICEFLFFEENGDKKEKKNYIDLKIQIRELIKNPFDRAVLTSVLLDLRKDVNGKTRAELLRVYQELELHKDAYKKLNSWRWEIISKGIYELTQMQVNDSYGLITRFINDKRATIRKQAEIATVSLKPEGINYFLDHTRYKISEWQQLKLLDVVRNKTDYNPPPFRLWLTSKNNHVVLFALRLIKYYNQNDASASLIRLLRHKSNHIKKEAIFCIRDFHVVDAVPVLKTIFWKCTNDVKMFILEALSQLGTEDDIGFLEELITKEVAFTVKGKAISALNTIRPEGVMPSNDILPKEDFENETPNTDPPVSSNEVIDNFNLPESPMVNKLQQIEGIEDSENVGDTFEALNEEIAFLPIVTDEPIKAEPMAAEGYSKYAEEHILARNLTVQYQEVSPLAKADELHFDFLPIVTDKSTDTETTEYALEELPVIYSEVTTQKQSISEETKTILDITHNLNVLFEEITGGKKPTKKTETVKGYRYEQTDIYFGDGIAKDVKDINVIYEPITYEKTIESAPLIDEIDWTGAFEPKSDQEVENKIDEDNDVDLSFLKEFGDIPKPLFYDDHVMNTMALLEDISDLGDYREIPHLNMLLQTETNVSVKNRINDLISRFSSTEDIETENIEIDFELGIQDARQSVFHGLFEVSDIDAKIILLTEIAEVGDEMEIPLLKTLTKHEDIHVRKAAKNALDKLSSRLLHQANPKITTEEPMVKEETNVKDTIDYDDIFTVEFDDETTETAPQIKINDTTGQQDGNTLFDHLCAMSTKLYNKK